MPAHKVGVVLVDWLIMYVLAINKQRTILPRPSSTTLASICRSTGRTSAAVDGPLLEETAASTGAEPPGDEAFGLLAAALGL